MKSLVALALLLGCSFSSFPQAAQPAFVTSAMDGTKIDTRALRGKIVVLNLWFINCPNCLAEIKMLNELVEQYQANPDVIFLAPAASRKDELARFLVKNPFKYQVLPDSSIIILSQFGAADKNGDINVPFPMHYVIDRDGNVVMKEQGVKGIEAVKRELTKQISSPNRSKAGN